MRVGGNMLVGAFILALTISTLSGGVVEGCFGVHSHQKLHRIGKQSALIGRHDFRTRRRQGYHQQTRHATKDPNEVSRLPESSISSANLDRSNLCSKRMVKPRSALHEDSSRRSWLEQVTMSTVSLAAILTGWSAVPKSWADEGVTSSGVEEFVRQGPDYGYAIRFPEAFEQTQKPLKTHLDEINFISPTVKGYQVGITVDPVRINSLREVRSVYLCYAVNHSVVVVSIELKTLSLSPSIPVFEM